MKIVSGGQTGADRGALEAALELGAPYGGWVPKGRKAEDGRVPEQFTKLREHPSVDYARRTWANVHDSDATVIICRLPPQGGSALTVRHCRSQDRPLLLLGAEQAKEYPGHTAQLILKWLRGLGAVRTLNVAGSRESSVPGLQAGVRQAIRSLLIQLKANEGAPCEPAGTGDTGAVSPSRLGPNGMRAPSPSTEPRNG